MGVVDLNGVDGTPPDVSGDFLAVTGTPDDTKIVGYQSGTATWVTAATGSGGVTKIRTWASGSTSVASDDHTLILTGTTGGTVVLPASPSDKREVCIIDQGGNAAVSPITINGNGKLVKDGIYSGSTRLTAFNGQSDTLVFSSALDCWEVVA